MVEEKKEYDEYILTNLDSITRPTIPPLHEVRNRCKIN
jgi:hypothetical protein